MTSQTAVSTSVFSIRLISKEKLLRRLIFLITIFVILPLLGFYLFQMGDFVRGNYLMKNYEQELKELTNQNLVLQETANNITSLEKVEGKVGGFNFVKVSKVKYISISSDYLVKE